MLGRLQSATSVALIWLVAAGWLIAVGSPPAAAGDAKKLEDAVAGSGKSMLETGRRIASDLTLTMVGDQDPGPISDISAFVDRASGRTLRVLPVLGSGGIRNLSDLMFLRGIDAAIVLGSSLDELKRRDTQLFDLAAGRLRYLARLYNAELHVIARRDRIATLADLAGKKVNFISPDGSADVVGRHVLAALGVEVKPAYVDLARSLEEVEAGNIAATFVFAGKPVDELTRLPAGTPLYLVPVDGGLDRVDSSYLPALIQHADYPNLVADDGEAVVTLAGPLLLATYDWPDQPQRGQRIRRFLDGFAAGFTAAGGDGRHPKWHDVNLAADMPGWRRDKTAAAWLADLAAGRLPSIGVESTGEPELPKNNDAPAQPPQPGDSGSAVALDGIDTAGGLGFVAE